METNELEFATALVEHAKAMLTAKLLIVRHELPLEAKVVHNFAAEVGAITKCDKSFGISRNVDRMEGYLLVCAARLCPTRFPTG